MNLFKLLLLTIIIFSCTFDKQAQSSPEKDFHTFVNSSDTLLSKVETISPKNEIELLKYIDSKKSYSDIKIEIQRIKNSINKNKISSDSLSNLFSKLLVEKIIPYWYGTKWSFEGHTSKPRVGKIACGYFVSTTLKHMELNLNKYKLAQQLPILEAKSISIDHSIIEISKSTIEENIIEIRNLLTDGIYFLGFDQSHVGYLYKKHDELYIIHSNILETKGVEIERIEESEVFSYFNRFYIAEISTNKLFLEKWLSNEKIKIITD